MSSSPSTTDFRADLAKIDKRSGRMPHYRADGQKGKSGNSLERDLVPPPAGSSVSTGSRKKPRIDDDSRSPQTGSRPSFPSNPSASRNSSQRLGGFTSTRQRLWSDTKVFRGQQSALGNLHTATSTRIQHLQHTDRKTGARCEVLGDHRQTITLPSPRAARQEAIGAVRILVPMRIRQKRISKR